MTSGAQAGTNGRPRLSPWLAAYAVIALATVAFGIVNTLSVLDERSWMSRPVDWWEPAVWEASSGIVLLSLAWISGLMIRRFPIAGRLWLRNHALHVAVTIPFSLVHVGLMVALRHTAYAVVGDQYDFGGGLNPLLYEYRKDVMSYTLYVATFWLTERLLGASAAGQAEPVGQTILIDEGQRTMRVAPRDLLCARSAGNYVEFRLANGRRPLMRTTLAAMEAQLAEAGFVRTHRSWLVNPAHVTEIEAEGSGDYGLTLADGTKVPVSRRYPKAMEALRTSG